MGNNPIGIFDSGIGGLTVAKAIIKILPSESIIYLGDTARVPYGTRSQEQITDFALELTNFLLKKNVKCLVVACNTISAIALEKIIAISPVPVIGVIDATVEAALNVTKNNKIGVIGTTSTIESKTYEEKIKSKSADIAVYCEACPLFVPLAEEGLHDHDGTKLIAKEYLKEIIANKVDTLILGCTHYPLLYKAISGAVGKKINLVDSAKPTANALKKLLEDNSLLGYNENPDFELLVTDDPTRVERVVKIFFGKSLKGKIKKVIV